MSDIRPKLSSLVSGQLPEFIREDYQTFVAFLEAYYEYLELNINSNYKDLRDIDNTLDDFLQYFKRELASNLPSLQVDERFLLQHVKEIYQAKGTSASFELLFRILFNKSVTVHYPFSQVLIPSNGKWIQDCSVFLSVSNGDPESIVGNTVDVITSTETFKMVILSYQPVQVSVGGILQNSTTVFEYFISKHYFNTLTVGSIVKYGTTFISTVVPTTVKATVIQGGTGFKVGQIYEIKSGTGIGSFLKVKIVDSVGAIKAAEFITFGVGYNTDFTAYLSSNPTVNTSSLINFNVVGTNVTLTDATTQFIESGIITSPNYNVDTVTPAFGSTYAGDVLREFYDANINNTVVYNTANLAIITVTVGALAQHVGYFKNNDGFLSDAVYIQDSRYYQAFSYVLKIDEQLDKYQSFVKTLLHPSGTAMFGEYSITNVIDLGTSLQSLLKILTGTLADVITPIEKATLTFSKLISGNTATTARGTPGVTNSFVPAAITTATALGTMIPSITTGITGLSLTILKDTVTPAKLLFGSSLASSGGTTSISALIPAGGNTLTSSRGAMIPSITTSITGNSLITSNGIVDPVFPAFLSGLTAKTSQAISTYLTTSKVGTAINITISEQSYAFDTGSVTLNPYVAGGAVYAADVTYFAGSGSTSF